MDAVDRDSYTPLLSAATFDKKAAFKHLMSSGASLSAVDKDRKSCVFLAAERNHTDILEVGNCSRKGKSLPLYSCGTNSGRLSSHFLTCDSPGVDQRWAWIEALLWDWHQAQHTPSHCCFEWKSASHAGDGACIHKSAIVLAQFIMFTPLKMSCYI